MKLPQTKSAPEIKFLYNYSPGRFQVKVLFPNNADSAFGSLGFQTVYHLFNLQYDFNADLIWLPDKRKKTDLSAEILALSIAYELDLFNFVQALIDARIEPLAARRKSPLIVCGGVLTLINPRPLIPFADIILLGDAELLIPAFADQYRRLYLAGKSQLLKIAAQLPGFFVPRYNSLQQVKPLIQPRQSVLHSWMIHPRSHFGSAFLIETGRGCPRKCRFCAAAHIHPYEFHPLEPIIQTIKQWAPPNTAIGLIGSSLSDHPQLETLINTIVESGHKITVSSLRPDVITPDLARNLRRGGMKTLTLAPEAGSLRLRKLLGKGMSDKAILQAVKSAALAKIPRLKLYFLIGLPEETMEDIEALILMVRQFQQFYPPPRMELSVNTLIPKPGTPFANLNLAPETYINAVRRTLRENLTGVSFTKRSYSLDFIQAALSQGDESAGLALLNTLKTGTSFKHALRQLSDNL